MREYLARRLLGFIPTLLLVLLLVFAVVNAVPTIPPGDMGEESSGNDRAAYLEFREQFGLDDPVFLNFRYLLAVDDLGQILQSAVGEGPSARAARDQLAELGSHAVSGLVVTVGDGQSPEEVRAFAAERLLPAVESDEIALSDDALLEARLVAAGQKGTWGEWFETHGDAYSLSTAECLRITFFETRFSRYLRNLAVLDFGVSMRDRLPVFPTLIQRLGNSALFVFLATLLAFALALPLGVFTARIRGSARERFLSLSLFALYSLPTYFAATLLLRFLSVGEPFDWFPTGGLHSLRGYEDLSVMGKFLDGAHHLVLPVVCLTYGSLAFLSRFARTSILESLSSDYVRTARAKGLPERAVFYRHAFRNGLLPILTLMGSILPAVFGGAVIIEIIFNLPGMGTYIFDAILDGDYNAILATTLLSAVFTLVGILLSDLFCAMADPRIRIEEGGA